MRDINSIATSQESIAEKLKDSPAWLRDAVTLAIKTEPKNATDAFDSLISQHDETQRTLKKRQSLQEEKIKQQYIDHSQKVQQILVLGTDPITYICKPLGLMGYDRNESQVNFDSLPCDSFDSRTDMEELGLESLTVSHNGSGSYLRGGIRAKISVGSPTFETRNF